MKAILTHPNADFDALASLVGAHKLYPDAVPILPARLNRNVREFVALYQSGLGLQRQADIDARRIHEVILVDTQKLPEMRGLARDLPLTIIDHHPLASDTPDSPTVHIEPVGATATLLIEMIQRRGLALGTLEATVLALGIYEDTGSLSYSATTPRDLRCVAWLLEQNAALDAVRRWLTVALTPEQMAIYEYLLTHAESRVINGYTVTVGAMTVDQPVHEISGVAHRLRDTLDPAALFVVIEMPRYVQLVCRSARDALDVGEIARAFGGGGHRRASAAAIEGMSGAEVVARLWEMLPHRVRPVVTVGELMSQGVRTVPADARISDIIRELRRVGHEGYPVLDSGRVVGLLTRRDADRSLEHGLRHATVREVMSAGEVTLSPHDSVSRLEQTIVQSGWGQIPVVDDRGELIGIVTRTDLIKHWAHTHPEADTGVMVARVDDDRLRAVLGGSVARLIERIASHAQAGQINAYLVGGCVRDLLLERANDDIDFVIEAGAHSHFNAITFAHQLQAEYGGAVSGYAPFGTAKWRLDAQVAQHLGVPLADLPAYVDFATSRNEFYEHPTALPTVYAGSIKLDLLRRDFTINTLAVQVSPAGMSGRVLDFYGGLSDLQNGTIRVLHSLSFVDDPTRVLRAVRFRHRLGFQIEARTAELIQVSLPMLKRITGERLRNELNLILREPSAQDALHDLDARGVLAAIHPALTVSPQIGALLARAQALGGKWHSLTYDPDDLRWQLWLAAVAPDEVAGVCDRLLIGAQFARALAQTVSLVNHPPPADARPSQIVARLDSLTDLSLIAVWLITEDPRLERYVTQWRAVRPLTDGHSLRARGLPSGPRYRLILDRLRAAWLDGEVASAEAEAALLESLIAEGDQRG